MPSYLVKPVSEEERIVFSYPKDEPEPTMSTVYLDHNIVHYFVRGFSGSREAEIAALKKSCTHT